MTIRRALLLAIVLLLPLSTALSEDLRAATWR